VGVDRLCQKGTPYAKSAGGVASAHWADESRNHGTLRDSDGTHPLILGNSINLFESSRICGPVGWSRG
jgi:hypothetical protein